MNCQKDNLSIKKVRRRVSFSGVGLIILSIIMSYLKKDYWLWSLPPACLLFLFAAFAPLKLFIIIEGIDRGSYYLRKVLFFLLFFLFITPSSIILRAIRPTLIPLKISTKQRSYWENVRKAKEDTINFQKQY